MFGTFLGNHANVPHLSKSVGQSIASGKIDVTLPSVPTGLTVGSPTATTLDISWSAATDNIAVAGYKLFRDASEILDTTLLSYTDTGLIASTSYTYTVLAYDAKGNESAQSAGVGGTTTA